MLILGFTNEHLKWFFPVSRQPLDFFSRNPSNWSTLRVTIASLGVATPKSNSHIHARENDQPRICCCLQLQALTR